MALKVGAGWAGTTGAFQFVLFHYVGGRSWTGFLRPDDLRTGNLCAFDVLGIAALTAVLRSRRLCGRPSRVRHA